MTDQSTKEGELKNCPFCGSQVFIVAHKNERSGGVLFDIYCNCGVAQVCESRPDIAKQKWNRREPSQREKELTEDLEFISFQSCDREPGSDGVITPCTETEMCITEYCWPCYAKKKLEYYSHQTLATKEKNES